MSPSSRRLAIGIGIAALAAFLLLRLLHRPAAPETTATPTALVTVAPAGFGPVSRTIEAYGVIAGSAAATRTLSTPHDVIVEQALVGPGQAVAAGAPLVVVADTPASLQAYRQAADAARSAASDLARVQRLYAQHLAANDQLIAAQKTLADAQAALAAQSAAGAGHLRQTLAAPVAGIVGQISAARGQQVAAGAPLMTLVASGGLVAQFGIEPGEAARLVPGQTIRIVSALDPTQAVESRLALIGGAVDPATRLISAIAPVTGAPFALGTAVRGEITVATSRVLTVPKAAVVYDENGAHVFVDRSGAARQIPVTIGPEQGAEIAVSGALRPGDPVIVAGAYQVQDGMPLRVAPR